MANGRKLYSAQTERRAIRTICGGGKFGAQVSAAVSEDHFVSMQDVYKRFKLIQRKRNHEMSWDELLSDPGIDEDTRNALAKGGKIKPARSREDVEGIVVNLNNYRKLRGLNKLREEIGASLSNGATEPDELLSTTSNRLAEINIGIGGFHVTKIGDNGNGQKLLRKVMQSEAVHYIPTGFATFDRRNHGIARGSLFLVAATTGGGKSALLNKIGRSMAEFGARVGFFPLEMDEGQMMVRTMADEAHQSMTKWLDPKNRLSKKEKQDAEEAYAKMERRIAKAGGSLEYIRPDEDIDIETALMYAKPKGLDVVIIDYVGLLKGADADDQPKALSRITRYAKRWADINNCIVILAAQLSDEGVVRYSQAMKEHSSNLWQWIYNSYSRENKVVKIEQTKARQQDPFPFTLYADLEFMEFRDLSEKEQKMLKGDNDNHKKGQNDNFRKGGKGGQRKVSNGKDYFGDI